MFEEKYNSICEILEINVAKNRSKRLLIFFISIFLAIAVGYLYDILMGIGIGIIGIILFKMEYYDLSAKAEKVHRERQIAFANLFSHLLVFIESKMNVYQAFLAIEEYTDQPLLPAVKELIACISSRQEIESYIAFASFFNSSSIDHIMILLYQFEQSGYEEAELRRLGLLLARLKANVLTDHVNKSAEVFNVFAFIPVVAILSVMLLFTISILSGMGVFINV